LKFAYGNLFSNGVKHLLVRRMVPSGVYIDVFSYRNKHFISLLSHKESVMNYVNDTVADVNGDKAFDLLVQWYPGAGCCLRNIYEVYIYLPESNSFTSAYQFINPTFYPSEKIIRGIGYGQPGEAALYKYKWNGLHIDTVEYIYHNTEDTIHHSYYRTIRRIEEDNVKRKVLKSLPAEYRGITDFDWFVE
ncbi:MAG TPA: hypothetical protein VK174_06780, partial [Chitinophagales bacterium]|nr:hypothetical protein [Chitinophagales bacterium]